MGIDAHMVVRNVKRTVATDEWLKLWSWRLCTAIGSEHFWTQDGLLPPDYETAEKAWREAFDKHPLFNDFNSKSDWQERNAVRDQILKDIGPSPDRRRLAIELVNFAYHEEGEPEPGTHYADDGQVELNARRDEVLLQVNLCGRYYGEGYERGDILTYCAIAEWLEQNIRGCEVWYGGDSSGVDLVRFDDDYRQGLRRHLFSPEGRDYFSSFGSVIGGTAPTPPACGLCPGGKYCGTQCGFGGNSFAAFHCSGCGKGVKTDDGGKTWTGEKRS